MSLLDNVSVKRVEKVLRDYDNEFKVIVLDNTARTALEAASSLGCSVGAIVKSLLIKTESNFTLFLVPGDKKASLKKIKKILEIKNVSMASAEDVKNVTGFSIGGVSPVGHINKIDIFMDKSFQRFEFLFAAAGHPSCVFKISFSDLQKITKSNINEISE
tara:strand:+ start:222 stop:701 length:480 start_codon:yes stop_codon:yes gene_type:complete